MSRPSRPISSLSLPPATLSQLIRDGYETLDDIVQHRPDILSQLPSTQYASSTQNLRLPPPGTASALALPATQSASSLTTKAQSVAHDTISTGCKPLDKLLASANSSSSVIPGSGGVGVGGRFGAAPSSSSLNPGPQPPQPPTTSSTPSPRPTPQVGAAGLPPGRILELSGPPGCPREKIILGMVREYVRSGMGVLFAECQNMINPVQLRHCLGGGGKDKDDGKDLIKFIKLPTPSSLLIFLHNLPTHLSSLSESAHPIKLLVLSSLSHHFQPFIAPEISYTKRTAFIEKIKQALLKACATHNISIITTSQLSVRLINADGTTGNFHTATKGIMVPLLPASYLPKAKSYRVLIAPESRSSGKLRLLASPRCPTGTVKGVVGMEGYVLDRGEVR